jgi:hypothetical protein
MVGHQVLVLGIGVRIPVSEPSKKLALCGFFTWLCEDGFELRKECEKNDSLSHDLVSRANG